MLYLFYTFLVVAVHRRNPSNSVRFFLVSAVQFHVPVERAMESRSIMFGSRCACAKRYACSVENGLQTGELISCILLHIYIEATIRFVVFKQTMASTSLLVSA